MSLENRMLWKGTTRKITSQERWFLSFFKPLISVGLPLMTPLAKSVLVPFGLMVAVSGTDAAIRKKRFGSRISTLVFSNKDVNDIM